MSVTPCSPFVSVPVLSNKTQSNLRADSSARRLRTSSPLRADKAVEIETTRGIAKPSACGQAIIKTVTARSSAKPVSLAINQNIKVAIDVAVSYTHLRAHETDSY